MKKVTGNALLALISVLVIPLFGSGPAEAGIYGKWGGPATIFPHIIRDDPNMTTLIM